MPKYKLFERETFFEEGITKYSCCIEGEGIGFLKASDSKFLGVLAGELTPNIKRENAGTLRNVRKVNENIRDFPISQPRIDLFFEGYKSRDD